MKAISFTILTSLVLLFQTICSQTPEPTSIPKVDDDSDVIKVSTNLIQIDVVVTDKNYRPVKNLKADDFILYENKKPREISSFSYISPKTTNRIDNSRQAGLGLESNKGGTSLKDKISIPTISNRSNSKNFRRTLVIVIDDIGLSFRSVGQIKDSLKSFIKKQVRQDDLVTIVTTGGASVLPAFTSDKKQLLATVKKIKWSPQSRGGADYYEPLKPTLLEEASSEISVLRDQKNAEQALLEDIELMRKNNSALGTIGALQYIVNGMQNLPGRKALVLFSEGFSISNQTQRNSSNRDADITGELPKASANNRFGNGVSDALRSLIEIANKSSVVIYPIDPRGLQYTGMAFADEDIRKTFGDDFKPGQTDDKRTSRDAYFRQAQEGLRVLASETGGFATLNQNKFDKGLEKILDDQSYYLLSFITETETIESTDNVYENIEIKLKNPELKVRYRNTLYSEESKKSFNQKPKSTREKVGLALAYPFKSNEIDLNLYSITANYAQGDFIRFLINVSAEDLEFKKQSKGMRKANFDLLALTLDANGKPVNQFAKNFSLSVNESTYKNILKKGFVYVLPVFLKKSGIYHFRIAIHDSQTGKVGAAAKFLETPKFEKKRLWLSNLILRSADKKVVNANLRNTDKKMFTDTTLRQFKLPLTLNYGAVIYNAKIENDNSPKLEIQTRLIKDNKIISETSFEPISTKNQKDIKRIDLVGNISLEKKLPPGNYILQIIVRDKLAKKKTQIATQWVDFELIN